MVDKKDHGENLYDLCSHVLVTYPKICEIRNIGMNDLTTRPTSKSRIATLQFRIRYGRPSLEAGLHSQFMTKIQVGHGDKSWSNI